MQILYYGCRYSHHQDYDQDKTSKTVRDGSWCGGDCGDISCCCGHRGDSGWRPWLGKNTWMSTGMSTIKTQGAVTVRRRTQVGPMWVPRTLLSGYVDDLAKDCGYHSCAHRHRYACDRKGQDCVYVKWEQQSTMYKFPLKRKLASGSMIWHFS